MKNYYKVLLNSITGYQTVCFNFINYFYLLKKRNSIFALLKDTITCYWENLPTPNVSLLSNCQLCF